MDSHNMNYSSGRNYGIDLLRIVSMFMVVMLHICGAGGVLNNTEVFSFHYLIAKALEIISYCAVNCYALISGFVGFQRSFRVSKIMNLWFQVVFYCLILSGFCCLVLPQNFSVPMLIKAVFPFTFSQYWYFTSYLVVIPFFPVLNIALSHSQKRHDLFLTLSIIFFFSVSPVTWLNDALSLNGGYSPIWLLCLYIIGALSKKYDIPQYIRPLKTLLLYCVCIITTLLLHMIYKYLCTDFPVPDFDNYFVNFLSPTILFSAFLLLCLFSKAEFSHKTGKLVSKIGVHAFAVYLIHTHPLIFQNFFIGRFEWIASCTPFDMFLRIILSSLIICCFCLILDVIRVYLFRVLRINQLCMLCDLAIDNWTKKHM